MAKVQVAVRKHSPTRTAVLLTDVVVGVGLFGEDAYQQARLQHWRKMVWDRLESRRDGGIKLHDVDFIAGERERAKVEALAIRVWALSPRRPRWR